MQIKSTHRNFLLLFSVIQSITGLSRIELSEKMGYSIHSVNSWFRGSKAPPLRAMVTLFGMLPEDPRKFIVDRLTSDSEGE